MYRKWLFVLPFILGGSLGKFSTMLRNIDRDSFNSTPHETDHAPLIRCEHHHFLGAYIYPPLSSITSPPLLIAFHTFHISLQHDRKYPKQTTPYTFSPNPLALPATADCRAPAGAARPLPATTSRRQKMGGDRACFLGQGG